VKVEAFTGIDNNAQGEYWNKVGHVSKLQIKPSNTTDFNTTKFIHFFSWLSSRNLEYFKKV
jgi:hypothetical protein